MAKVRLTYTKFIEYEINPDVYGGYQELESIVDMDIEDAKEDPCLTFDFDNSKNETITGEILEE